MTLRFLHTILLACCLAGVCRVLLTARQKEAATGAAGPVYLELDSWAYPAFKRLAALGYLPDEEGLAAPWTRRQCMLLVEEAEDVASRRSTRESKGANHEEAIHLIFELKAEFTSETAKTSMRIDSIYGRVTQIAGMPLRDSYHFGQTFVNDFGRPYGSGANTIDGFTAYALTGRFSGYIRGEYQQAGTPLLYSRDTLNLIATVDGVPPGSQRTQAASRFDPLEMYVGVHALGFDVTAGKQSLWWGPGEQSAYHFSNNAEPLYALRIAQSGPIILPGPLRLLGRIRTQFLLARLQRNLYPARPLLNAQKITLQVTEHLELGFTRSAIFGGAGHPLTTSSVLAGFFSTGSTGRTGFGAANDPGDRRSGFDFRWQVPGLRRYVTIYSDSLADDDPNPLDNPRRSAWAPGIYLTQMPGLKHLDLRFETYSTWLYERDAGGQFIYWNNQYRDAYTNSGNIIGSWIGRDSRAYTASSTYWWSAHNKLAATFRQTKTGSNFIPGGATQTDVSVNSQWELLPGVMGAASVQFERFFVPVLGAPRKNVTTSLQFTYYPKNLIARR